MHWRAAPAVPTTARRVQVSVGIGPEGGLAAEDVAAAGVPAVDPGPSILRTGTATVVGSALVMDRAGRSG